MSSSHHASGKQEPTPSLCLAIVRENGTDVILFDASGKPRTFSYKGNPAQLCFSTHGTIGADDFLTPCLDEDGLHGVPEEGCFCGVETPHLHAHKHDDAKCKEEEPASGCSSKKKKNLETDVSYLASVTLHPTDDGDDDHAKTDESAVLLPQFEVNDYLPRECNSHAISTHMSSHHDDDTNNTRLGRRVTKIQHGDHVDHLVHNEKTGDLHLQHDDCNSCGKNDVHGKFDFVSQRKLLEGDVQVHFFKPSSKPFSLLDSLSCILDISNVFDPESDRVAAAKHPIMHHKKKCCDEPTCKANLREMTASERANKGDDWSASGTCTARYASGNVPAKKESDCCSSGVCTASEKKVDDSFASGTCTAPKSVQLGMPAPPSGTKVRSTFHCSGICCASEIPLINTVLEPKAGVSNILINVPVKQVMVDHDPSVISAAEVAQILNIGGFGATLKRDGAATFKGNTAGRSHFFVEKICCASEIPAINFILEPMKGVTKVSINVTAKMVYVNHDTVIISATALCEALNDDCFGAHVKHDAKDDIGAPLTAFVRSSLSFTGEIDNDMVTAYMSTFGANQVESFVVDLPKHDIHVVHNPLVLPIDEFCESIKEHLYIEATVTEDGAANTKWEFPELVDDDVDEPDTAKYPRVTVILSGIFWLISMLSLIGGKWDYLKYVALASVAFGLPHIGLKAFKTLKRFQFDTNVLMFSATIGAVALQEYTEAAAVAFLFGFSEWLETRATVRARNALGEIVNLRPDKANLVHPSTKEIVLVPAAAVPVGALVSVKTGDKIPCDGMVLTGRSTVDESSLTGESRPVRKGPRDKVSGGTINSGMVELMVRTTCTSEDSAVSRLIRLVEEAQANRSETEKLVDEFARYYTPFVIFAALCMCTIPWAFGNDIGRTWTNNGLVLLVVACPCALIISTPVTYVAGLAATAQRGVIVKGGAHLETLGMVKRIAFDKTGTLTQGNFALLHLKNIGEGLSRGQVLETLALVEERAHHPLAQAIITGVQNEGIKAPKTRSVKDPTNLAGEGLTATVDGITVHVGNKRLFDRLGLFESLPDIIKEESEKWASLGGTVGFMSIDGHGIVCAYSVADAVRPESAEVVKALQKMGVEVTMLTGDNNHAALVIGKQIGLDTEHIRSQLFPEDKLRLVQEMKDETANVSGFGQSCRNRPRTMFCGDGVNDAPALAISDVGVAMGAGAALAMETSDVTLLDSNLEKLIYSMRIGKRVIRKIRENVVFSFVVKAIVLAFTLSGSVHLWAAIAADVGAMLVVTLNGMTLLPYRKQRVELDVKAAEENLPESAREAV
jgi:Cd2+/Zn2+-exporting ATPase